MTTYILEGGLGNLLFQLNYFYSCRDYLVLSGEENSLKLGIINSTAREIYFKLSPANANRDMDILYQLTGISPDNIYNSSVLIGLGLSKTVDAPFFGFFHDKHSHLSIKSSLVHKFVFTYGQNNITISAELLGLLRSRLVHSDKAMHIRQNMLLNSYDSVLHFRVSDTNDFPNKNLDYILDVCQPFNKVLVITNDMRKARSILTSRKFCFLPDKQPLIDDLLYMVNSKVLICSSSTLSWWASEVSSDDQAIYFPAYSSLSNYFNPASNKYRIFY